MVIAQAVEHQCEQLTGGGDHADVAAAAFADPVAVAAQPGGCRDTLHGFDGGPAHQAVALFICGTRDVKPGAHFFRIFFWCGWRVGAVVGSRLGRSPTAQRP